MEDINGYRESKRFRGTLAVKAGRDRSARARAPCSRIMHHCCFFDIAKLARVLHRCITSEESRNNAHRAIIPGCGDSFFALFVYAERSNQVPLCMNGRRTRRTDETRICPRGTCLTVLFSFFPLCYLLCRAVTRLIPCATFPTKWQIKSMQNCALV